MFSAIFSRLDEGTLSLPDLDDALWSALIEKVFRYDKPSFLELPESVRNFYASHDFEYSVGNAGFYEASTNTPESLKHAKRGYEALGLLAASNLIQEAINLLELEGRETDEYLDQAWAALDSQKDAASWWAGTARSSYAHSNRAAFVGLDETWEARA